MAQAVREALSAFASAEVATRVLHRAMHMSEEHEVPVGGRRLRRFLDPHLESAIEFVLGQDEATAILEMLAPMVRLAPDEDEVSQIRASFQVRSPAQVTAQVTAPVGPAPPVMPRPARLPTGTGKLPSLPALDAVAEEPTPAPRALAHQQPVVLIASLDCMRVDDLTLAFGAAAQVHEVPDAVALLETLGSIRCHDPIMILDCSCPSVQPQTMAMLAPELPPEITVVLWGADEATEQELIATAGGRGRWLRCTADASAEALVALVDVLAG